MGEGTLCEPTSSILGIINPTQSNLGECHYTYCLISLGLRVQALVSLGLVTIVVVNCRRILSPNVCKFSTQSSSTLIEKQHKSWMNSKPNDYVIMINPMRQVCQFQFICDLLVIHYLLLFLDINALNQAIKHGV